MSRSGENHLSVIRVDLYSFFLDLEATDPWAVATVTFPLDGTPPTATAV